MTYLMVFHFLRNTRARWIPLITQVAYLLTFMTVITMTQTQNLTFSIVNNENFSCGYVGEPEYNEVELKSRTFSSDSENESNGREDDDLNSSRQKNFVLV